MLNKIYKILGAFILLLLSFFYTDFSVNLVRKNDPLMKEIVKYNNETSIKAVNANINNNLISSGITGKEIDIEKSYQNMKKENVFNESLLIYKDVLPNTSVLNTYDKFIVKGSNIRNEIALTFKIDNLNNIDKLTSIINNKGIIATLFIDGKIVEENINKINSIMNENYYIENFGYNDLYTKEMLEWTNNLIYSITNIYPKFCYSEYNNYDILDLCSKEKMYTVKPIVVNNNPFITIKNTLSSGNIYSLNINDETLKELPIIINYIKQKGFDLVDLNTIIMENREIEK